MKLPYFLLPAEPLSGAGDWSKALVYPKGSHAAMRLNLYPFENPARASATGPLNAIPRGDVWPQDGHELVVSDPFLLREPHYTNGGIDRLRLWWPVRQRCVNLGRYTDPVYEIDLEAALDMLDRLGWLRTYDRDLRPMNYPRNMMGLPPEDVGSFSLPAVSAVYLSMQAFALAARYTRTYPRDLPRMEALWTISIADALSGLRDAILLHSE